MMRQCWLDQHISVLFVITNHFSRHFYFILKLFSPKKYKQQKKKKKKKTVCMFAPGSLT
jgi:hypothetical protein